MTVALSVVAVVIVGAQADAATTAKTLRFTVSGTVVQTGVTPAPDAEGATGGFVLHLDGASPNSINSAADDNGNITVYYRADTGYHQCDANGENCGPSTLASVVTVGAHVKAMGRYYATAGQYTLVADDVFNPTKAVPPPPPPPGPNPQPSGAHDFNNTNLFGVRGKVVATKVDALGGFKVSQFDATNGYGCGSVPNCRVQRIAAAHSNQLTIDPKGVETTYYVSDDGGCIFHKTTDQYTVINRRGVTDGLKVSGRYIWGGLDWVFTATRIWTPAPLTASNCTFGTQGGPLEVASALTESDPGTFAAASDATPESWTNSQWQGTNGAGDFGAGSTVMQLDWALVDGVWQFWGTYQVAAGPTSTTAISGDIQGQAAPQSSDPTQSQWNINAQLTITQTSGKYAGWQGDGSWTGFGTGEWSAPPSAQQGTFHWEISPG